MKKTVAFTLALVLLLTLAATALAYSFYDTGYPLYEVESYRPNGYCYLYEEASDSDSVRNLGRYNNGDLVRVISHHTNGYYKVVTQKNQVGYIHDYALTPCRSIPDREIYRVYSTDPAGYCYMYDRPSSVYGENLGRYDNGAFIEMVDWYASPDYAQVMSPETRKYGYIRKNQLVPEEDYKPVQAYAVVDSTDPKGYCYMYDRPSSVYGNNMGRYNNGERFLVIDWYADDHYAQVESVSTHKIGYVRKGCLRLR